MTQPTPTPYPELVQIQQAQKDMAFQMFLARSFGHPLYVEEPDDLSKDHVHVVEGFRWRGCIYITKHYKKELPLKR